MTNEPDQLNARLSAQIHTERLARGWSLTQLAQRSNVSRAMINKIERNQSSPTATLLVRLASAFDLTLSALLARAEGTRGGRLLRARDQQRWQDPETGYTRVQIAPAPDSALPLEIVRVELPIGKEISFPAATYSFIRQIIWVLDGELTFLEGETTHALQQGDSLELGPPADCTFRNAGEEPCSYIVTLLRQQ